MNEKLNFLRHGLMAAGLIVLATAATAAPLPPFDEDPDSWVGGKPVSNDNLEGRVGLVHVWTYLCWNCYRSFPWLNELEAEMPEVVFVGIHTPEFDREKDRDLVEQKSAEFGLDHPSMLDNDMAYWRALNNRYWPTWYLVDKTGQIRHTFIGEIHAGDKQAKDIKRKLAALQASE